MWVVGPSARGLTLPIFPILASKECFLARCRSGWGGVDPPLPPPPPGGSNPLPPCPVWPWRSPKEKERERGSPREREAQDPMYEVITTTGQGEAQISPAVWHGTRGGVSYPPPPTLLVRMMHHLQLRQGPILRRQHVHIRPWGGLAFWGKRCFDIALRSEACCSIHNFVCVQRRAFLTPDSSGLGINLQLKICNPERSNH